MFDATYTKSYEIVTINDLGTRRSLDVHENTECADYGDGNPRWEWGEPFTIIGECNDEIAVGEWHHVVGTYDASTGIRRLYQDGQLVAEGTAPYVATTVTMITIGGPATWQGSARGCLRRVPRPS